MNFKPIIVLGGEPHSIFWEIFIKALKYKKYKSPIILIGSFKLLKFYAKKLNYNLNVKILKNHSVEIKDIEKNRLNIIDIKFIKNKSKKKLVSTNNFIKKTFEIALMLLKNKITNKLLNGPINKKRFLNRRYLGITEYLAEKANSKNFAMLIYNKKISVCPLTTHLPLRYVSKQINKKLIVTKVELINNFYKNYLKIIPNIAITGLNPHCESIDAYNEDEKIIVPSVKILKKKGINISGPYPADTIFMKKNRSKFNIIIGMYHDQILTPIKTLFEFDAINITLGLPFIRVSPDHGPNEKMVGKNLSNPLSLIRALQFLDN